MINCFQKQSNDLQTNAKLTSVWSFPRCHKPTVRLHRIFQVNWRFNSFIGHNFLFIFYTNRTAIGRIFLNRMTTISFRIFNSVAKYIVLSTTRTLSAFDYTKWVNNRVPDFSDRVIDSTVMARVTFGSHVWLTDFVLRWAFETALAVWYNRVFTRWNFTLMFTFANNCPVLKSELEICSSII